MTDKLNQIASRDEFHDAVRAALGRARPTSARARSASSIRLSGLAAQRAGGDRVARRAGRLRGASSCVFAHSFDDAAAQRHRASPSGAGSGRTSCSAGPTRTSRRSRCRR